MQQSQEILMFTSSGSRNPIARSFGAGINQPQVVPSKRRRVARRDRYVEFDDG